MCQTRDGAGAPVTGSRNPRIRGALSTAAAIGIACAFAAFEAAAQADAVRYVGLDKVHLDVVAEGPMVGETFLVELRRDDETVLDQAAATPHRFKKNDNGLGAGTYTYQIYVHYRYESDYKQIKTAISILQVGTASVTGTDVSGTLVFDEEITDVTLSAMGITVPDGLTLNISRTTVTKAATLGIAGTANLSDVRLLGDGSNVSGTLFKQQWPPPRPSEWVIAGTLALDRCVFHPDTKIGRFYRNPIQFNGPVTGGEFSLFLDCAVTDMHQAVVRFSKEPPAPGFTFGGAGNSSFAQCGDLDVSADRAVSFDGCSNTVLRFRAGADVTVNGGSLGGWGGVGLENCDASATIANARVDLADVSLAIPVGSQGDWGGGSEVTFTRCEFYRTGVSYMFPRNVKYNNCTFLQPITINGAAPEFTACEFAKTVSLCDRTDALFLNNIFHEPLLFTHSSITFRGPDDWGTTPWWVDSPVTPTVSGNSFLGVRGPEYYYNRYYTQTDKRVSQPQKPIPIGANYYGEATGPELFWPHNPAVKAQPFLGGLGATVIIETEGSTVPFFTLAPFNSSGKRSSDRRVFPSFWRHGWIAGQHVVPHQPNNRVNTALYQGKETLLSVLIGTSANRVSGVRLRVEFDGQPVQPAGGATEVVGSLAGQSSTSLEQGMHTFDYMLPAVDKASAQLKVWLDTTGVSGYEDAPDGGAVSEIITENLTFRAPASAPLRVQVVPVTVGGLRGRTPANIFDFTVKMKDALASMLPLRWSQDIQVSFGSAVSVFTENVTVDTVDLNITARKITKKGLGLIDLLWGGVAPHVFVALMPANSMGTGVSGAFLALTPNVIFVEEDAPEATIHELGHSGPGLYFWREQYNMPEYRPTGMQLTGVTAVGSEPESRIYPNPNRNTRFVHLGATGRAWTPGQHFFDVMGNIEPSWVAPSTFSSFADWLQATLGGLTTPVVPNVTAGAPARESARPAAADVGSSPDPAPAGMRRVFFSMRTVRHPIQNQHLPDLGTVRACDVTSLSGGMIRHTHDPAYMDYVVEAFDAGGARVFIEGFQINGDIPGPPAEDRFTWESTCDIPENAARLVMRHAVSAKNVIYFDQSLMPALSARLLAPASGAVVGDLLTVRWEAAPAATPPLRGQPPQHLLLASFDGGETWKPVSGQIEGSEALVPTTDWPSETPVSLRLLTSDGLRTVVSQADNLRIPNRPPQATLLSPAPDAASEVDVTWTLRAAAADPDGALPDGGGVWTSSRDGLLGNGATLADVALSPGTHTLAYTVTDAAGATGRVAVTVQAGFPSNTVPVTLAADALQVIIPGRDRYEQAWSPLATGLVHTAMLSLRVNGQRVALRARLYLTAPGAAERLLDEAVFEMVPFSAANLAAAFTPDIPGEYRFRATLERGAPAAPVDGLPQWTWQPEAERSWTHTTDPDTAVTITVEGAGTVWLAPGGEACPIPFAGRFARGRALLLLAVPEPGWRFDGWDGAASATGNALSLVVRPGQRAHARFVPGAPAAPGSLRVSLRDAVPGAEQMEWQLLGTAAWQPAGGTLAGLQPGAYLVAFRNIPGHPAAPPRLVEIGEGEAVEIRHAVEEYAILVTVDPDGGGAVAGETRYAPGAAVRLVAEPAAQHFFVEWTENGTAIPGGPELTFTADRHRQITARFRPFISIATVDDLQKIGRDPAFPATHAYRLSGAVDARATRTWNGGRGFEPIADFRGFFDGRGYPITGLHIDRPNATNVGFFARNNGTIADVVLKEASVRGRMNVGGLVGDNFGWIRDCEADVSVRGAVNVGGLVGKSSGGRSIDRCCARGPVTGEMFVGGLVGLNGYGSTVGDCYASGSATASVRGGGGLVGRSSEGTITRCYAAGPVSGAAGSIGGLVGEVFLGHTVSASFWDTQTSGMATSNGGTGRTTAAMRQQATFTAAGWDFDTVWTIREGSGYPQLRRAWTAPPDDGTVTVTFDAQGGATETTAKEVVPGTPYGALPAPARAGFTFDGWRTAPNGGGTPVTAATLVTAAADHTLYANWTEGGDEPLTTAGSFDGYFQRADDFDGAPATAVRGTLTVKITSPEGRLTAKVVLQGGNVSFSGKAWDEVTADGTCRVALAARGGEALNLFVRQQRMWGTLAGGKAGDAPLALADGRNRFADRADAAAAALLDGFRGYYTVALPVFDAVSHGEADAAPRGAGYLAVTIGAKGSAKVAGVLADGTKVSRAGRLILDNGEGPAACVPLFAPLYTKKGWAGGLLRLDPAARTVATDRDAGGFVRWEKPGRGIDGFSLLLDACGGFYAAPAPAAGYRFTAEADAPYWHAEGQAASVALPAGLPVAVAGARLTIAKGAKPRKIQTEDGTVYLYDEANPANATLSFMSRTGIFKGAFVLYYDFEAGGRLQHKAVKAPYAGILTPVRDAAFEGEPLGMGHCLVPDNDPAFKALRLKRSYPARLESE